MLLSEVMEEAFEEVNFERSLVRLFPFSLINHVKGAKGRLPK
jgi:hypothetical protein